MHRFSNNAVYTLTVGVDDTETEFALTADDAGALNVPSFNWDGSFQALTLYNATMPGVYEIVHVTLDGGSGSYTVVRGAESLEGIEGEGTAVAWPAGTKAAARVTAGMLKSFVQGGHVWDSDSSEDTLFAGQHGAVHALRGVSLNAPVYAPNTFAVAGFPAVQRYDTGPYGGTNRPRSCGQEGVVATHNVNLGVVPAWAATTVYGDQAVIRPTTPDGYQYWLDIKHFVPGDTDTSGATEPTWVAGQTTVVEGEVYWSRADLATGVELDFGADVLFLPTEVGFICTGYGVSVSAAPFITVESADVGGGALVTNQQLTITGEKQWHRFTSVPNEGMHAIRFKLNTAATGDAFTGRFYAKGVFVAV